MFLGCGVHKRRPLGTGLAVGAFAGGPVLEGIEAAATGRAVSWRQPVSLPRGPLLAAAVLLSMAVALAPPVLLPNGTNIFHTALA